MALLEMGGRRFTLPQGDVLLGSDPSSAIPLSAPGVLPAPNRRPSCTAIRWKLRGKS